MRYIWVSGGYDALQISARLGEVQSISAAQGRAYSGLKYNKNTWGLEKGNKGNHTPDVHLTLCCLTGKKITLKGNLR